jgi:hypothetical protein
MDVHTLAVGGVLELCQTSHGCRMQAEELCSQGAFDRVGSRADTGQEDAGLINLPQAVFNRLIATDTVQGLEQGSMAQIEGVAAGGLP